MLVAVLCTKLQARHCIHVSAPENTLISCGFSCDPAGGFTADNPFPSRFSDYSPVSTGSPGVHRGFGMPQALQVSSPRPSAGLPLVGMVNTADLELQQRRQFELQEMQAQALAQAQAQAQVQAQVQTVA